MCAFDLKTESIRADTSFASAITEAIFPRIRGKILALFMLNPEKRYYFRETVRIIGDSPASIQRELKSLTAAGILKMEPIGIQKFYGANTNSPVYSELQSIVKKTFGVPDALKEALKVHAAKIQFAWINGGGNSGKGTAGDEIDLTIVGTLWVGDLAAILEPVEKSIGRPIAPNLYSKEDFAQKCKYEPNFRETAVDFSKLFLVGNPDDLHELI